MAEEDLREPNWDERMEKSRNKYLKERYKEHAPKARSFKTPSRKGEEISNYALIMKLKKQQNKNASDKELHDLVVRELVKQAPTSSKEWVANFWNKKEFEKKKASGGSVKGRPAKRSAENS